jgi:MinD-like ATPase involved in chromosome partitioning or flagellar assembly
MTLRVATVLSAREWEARLVAAARASATVRLTLRAFRPGDVSELANALDVVVVGSETPWATPARLMSWQRVGLRVVGIHPLGDGPAADRLRSGGADVVLSDDLDAEVILREIRLLEPVAASSAEGKPLTVVTGARGAPGRTEIAVALAWSASRSVPTTLLDADTEAPGVSIRLGLEPRPDLTDAVDRVHETGGAPTTLLHSVGRLGVLPGSHRRGEPRLRAEPVLDVIDALRSVSGVIVDAGPSCPDDLLKASDEAIVVVDATPRGIVRATALIESWTGPPPSLVLNRVRRSGARNTVRSLRRWTGLDPLVVLGDIPTVAAAARVAGPPPKSLLNRLRPLSSEMHR